MTLHFFSLFIWFLRNNFPWGQIITLATQMKVMSHFVYQNLSTQYWVCLRVIMCPLLMWFSDYTSISDIVASQKNIMSAIKTPTFKSWSTKDPKKVRLILPEHQMCQVLFQQWTRYWDGSKEVVSIRAIWERISFVGPVPAKHVAFFALYLHTWDFPKEFQKWRIFNNHSLAHLLSQNLFLWSFDIWWIHTYHLHSKDALYFTPLHFLH